MHILLALLSAIVTILYVLDRIGIDIGWYNPWSWRRRRAWAMKHDGDPIYSVEDPIHAAAIFVTGAAKLDGDLSQEQKQAILEMMDSIAAVGGGPTQLQQEYLLRMRDLFAKPEAAYSWA